MAVMQNNTLSSQNEVIILRESNNFLSQQNQRLSIENELLHQKIQILANISSDHVAKYKAIILKNELLQSHYTSSQSLLEEHDSTKEQNERLLTETQSLKESINDLSSKNQILSNKVSQYEITNKKLDDEIRSTNLEINDLNEIINDRDDQISQLQHKLVNFEAMNNNNYKMIDDLQQQLKIQRLNVCDEVSGTTNLHKNYSQSSLMHLNIGSNYSLLPTASEISIRSDTSIVGAEFYSNRSSPNFKSPTVHVATPSTKQKNQMNKYKVYANVSSMDDINQSTKLATPSNNESKKSIITHIEWPIPSIGERSKSMPFIIFDENDD